LFKKEHKCTQFKYKFFEKFVLKVSILHSMWEFLFMLNFWVQKYSIWVQITWIMGCFFIFIFIFYLFIFWRRLVRIMNNLAEMHFCTSMTLEITTTDSPQQQAQTSTSNVNPIIDFAQTQLIIYARMHEHISRKVHTVHTLFRRGVTCLHPRW